jgi:hypothetical protein
MVEACAGALWYRPLITTFDYSDLARFQSSDLSRFQSRFQSVPPRIVRSLLVKVLMRSITALSARRCH